MILCLIPHFIFSLKAFVVGAVVLFWRKKKFCLFIGKKLCWGKKAKSIINKRRMYFTHNNPTIDSKKKNSIFIDFLFVSSFVCCGLQLFIILCNFYYQILIDSLKDSRQFRGKLQTEPSIYVHWRKMPRIGSLRQHPEGH